MGKYESRQGSPDFLVRKKEADLQGQVNCGDVSGTQYMDCRHSADQRSGACRGCLFIDESGKVKVLQIEVQGDIHAEGTIKAGKLEGDGSSIVVKNVTLEDTVAQLLDKIAALEAKQKDLEARQNTVSTSLAKWGDQKKANYGDGVYSWTYKQAVCPEGYYVVGIQVRYRGTCLGTCNADGGVIGDIELDCRKLGVPGQQRRRTGTVTGSGHGEAARVIGRNAACAQFGWRAER